MKENTMKKILVLGTCSCCCGKTEKLIRSAAQKNNVSVDLTWQKDLNTVVCYNIMKTPAVIIDDVIVHEGGIPTEIQITRWLLK